MLHSGSEQWKMWCQATPRRKVSTSACWRWPASSGWPQTCKWQLCTDSWNIQINDKEFGCLRTVARQCVLIAIWLIFGWMIKQWSWRSCVCVWTDEGSRNANFAFGEMFGRGLPVNGTLQLNTDFSSVNTVLLNDCSSWDLMSCYFLVNLQTVSYVKPCSDFTTFRSEEICYLLGILYVALLSR